MERIWRGERCNCQRHGGQWAAHASTSFMHSWCPGTEIGTLVSTCWNAELQCFFLGCCTFSQFLQLEWESRPKMTNNCAQSYGFVQDRERISFSLQYCTSALGPLDIQTLGAGGDLTEWRGLRHPWHLEELISVKLSSMYLATLKHGRFWSWLQSGAIVLDSELLLENMEDPTKYYLNIWG